MSVPYADILILALVAGFILLRLRSILGEDVGFDGRSDNDESSNILSAGKESDNNVLPLRPGEILAEENEDRQNSASASLIEKLPEFLREKIEDIKNIEPEFDLSQFITGAQGAFEMVMKAFHNNDKETLKYLLADDIEDMFVEEAQKRADADVKSETTLVSIAETEIEDIELKNKHASITVTFTSEQIHVERDKDGKIVSGDASRVERVEDEWTFERDMGNKNPNWIITAT